MARTLFRKGSTLANAVIFEFASTNLVFELGLVLLILLGLQFLAAEFVGGLVDDRAARRHLPVHAAPAPRRAGAPAGRPRVLERMEGHGAMDMSVGG